jgi:hypothetical protein
MTHTFARPFSRHPADLDPHMLDPDECGDFGAYRAFAEAHNAARAAWLDDAHPETGQQPWAVGPDEPGPDGRGIRGDRNPLHVEMVRLREQAVAERAAYRQTLEATGARFTGGGVDVASYLDDQGEPDVSTDEGAAYWAEVARAAELGVPNTVGIQR